MNNYSEVAVILGVIGLASWALISEVRRRNAESKLLVTGEENKDLKEESRVHALTESALDAELDAKLSGSKPQ